MKIKKRKLKQNIIKINNKEERIKIWQALIWLDHEGTDYYLKQIQGINFIERGKRGMDCREYAIKEKTLEDLIPSILEHTGMPKKGEIVIYGNKIYSPKHMGVYLGNNEVISKWGDKGPIIKHQLNQVLLDYGNKVLFSTYKSPRNFNYLI